MTNRNVQSTVATSGHTTNYDLPLWSGQDITTWQGNLNDAFNKIDTAMYENKTLMLGYKAIADKLEETNSSTVELVNQVNAQLAEINANYQEVKDGLAAANQKITEAEQAIINLQHEDESVKVQMDTMQDDIGELMEWHTGILIDISSIPGADTDITGTNGGVFHILGARFVSSIISFTFTYTQPTNNITNDAIPMDNEIVSAIINKLNISNPTYYSIPSIAVSPNGIRIVSEVSALGVGLFAADINQYLAAGTYNAKALVSQSH